MKNKKKLFIIIGSVLVLLTLIVGIYFIFFNNDDEKGETKPLIQNNNQDKVVAPASNTEDLIQEMNKVEVTNVTEDEIIFAADVKLKENEKVAVWIYSEPKFLGYFEVLIEDGIKKIVGLKEVLENISIEDGKHNIAITTESGENIGYIDVYIKDNGKLTKNVEETKDIDKLTEQVEETKKEKEVSKETENIAKKEEKITTKEITETIEINFETTKQEEVNMLRGTTSVVHEGQKGQKKVTYQVTYDSNGKEIKREKKSEIVIKEPVNRMEKAGTSDFNMNSDMLTEVSWGPMCTELTINEYGDKSCEEGSLKYTAVKINNTYYITSITENDANRFTGLIKTTGTEGINLVATYNGTKYYFYMSAGGGMYELLTEKTCSEYRLSCGRW